mmetsp:Transcript_17037/g.34637  ORF Transcript_17037/g.34637 Transcript_17037/m.34637 type:complete len:244 (+) Transcript_17037:392-1123(+)
MASRNRHGILPPQRNGRRRSSRHLEMRGRTRIRQHPILRAENARRNLCHCSQSRSHHVGGVEANHQGSGQQGPRSLRSRRSLFRHVGMRILQIVGHGSFRRHGIPPSAIRRRSGSQGRRECRRRHRDASRISCRKGGIHQLGGEQNVGARRRRSTLHRGWMGRGKVRVGRAQILDRGGGHGGDARRAQKSQDRHSVHFSRPDRRGPTRPGMGRRDRYRCEYGGPVGGRSTGRHSQVRGRTGVG